MKTSAIRSALAAFILTGSIHAQVAQVPPLINYQGRVAVGTVNFDGAGLFKFALVNEDGTLTFWSNDGTSVAGSEPADAVSIGVGKGLYSVLLGDVALPNMAAIPAAAFSNADVRLRVWFDDGVNGSQLLTPDQRLAPAAYLSAGAVTSAAIADGAIVGAKIAPGTIDGTRIAAGSLDFNHLTVPAAPGAGQVLSFNGVTLNWAAPGAGDGIWAGDATLAYYLGGGVAIGTATPNPGYKLAVNGGVQFTPGGPGGTIQFGNPNSETGMTMTGAGRADLRFNGSTLKLVAGAGGVGPPSDASGIVIDTTGLVGIGLLSPTPGYKLAVNGGVQFTPGGPGGTMQFGTPNSETGMTWTNASTRADLRFNGSTLKLVAGPAGGPPSSFSGVAVTTAGNVGIGTDNPQTKLHVIGTIRSSILTITGGADIAEPFPMKEDAVEKGAVVVIDDEHPGRLRRSTRAYDTRVAGIVSGANGINAGIALHQEGALEAGQNVALSGRVYVQADATHGAIKPGDMLTTSDTPGHAMKVSEHSRAQGAIIGKAMSPLADGRGFVLVLVTLQ